MVRKLKYKNNCFDLRDNENVLDCLLRESVVIPHSCKAGVCQSCLMQAASGEIPEAAQAGLKDTLKKKKIFLACQCYPVGDMNVEDLGDIGLEMNAEIIEKEFLNHNVLRVVLEPEKIFECEPGQYLTFVNECGIARSYSVANNPGQENRIELHIRIILDGKMSQWLEKKACVGNRIKIRGPFGNCFYSAQEKMDFPIVLAGTGTGLSPLFGIINEALRLGHEGSISLYHGALVERDLYLVEKLQALSEKYKNFVYTPCVLNGEDGCYYKTGDLLEVVMQQLPENKSKVKLFLCGASEMVNSLKMKTFLAGVSSQNIYSDSFLPSK